VQCKQSAKGSETSENNKVGANSQRKGSENNQVGANGQRKASERAAKIIRSVRMGSETSERAADR